ncbi:MAG: hypothetical protein R6X14_06715 [bacterium]
MNALAALTLLAAFAVLPEDTGDRLYEAGLAEAAATEYLRELHAGTANPGQVRLKLAFSHAAAGESEPAAVELRELALDDTCIGPAAALALAGLFAGQGRFERARLELDGLAAHLPVGFLPEFNRHLAWLELNCGLRTTAATRYKSSDRTNLAERLALPPARRSPELAIGLSAFLPGAGEIYAGRTADGLLSLLVTGTSAAGTFYAARSGDWVSAGLVFSMFFLRFYSGARSNAAARAEDFNRAALRQYIARFDAAPDWFERAEDLAKLRWEQPVSSSSRFSVGNP